MPGLIPIFVNNILPALLIIAVGYLLGLWFKVDPKSLSTIVFYVLSPCLIFNVFMRYEINDAEFLKIGGIAVLGLLGVGLLAWLLGKMLTVDRKVLNGLILTALLPNAGNLGLSVNHFAFGEEGLAYASVYFVGSATLSYTAGVLIASMGSKSVLDSIKNLVKVPVVYAVLLGFLMTRLDLHLPIFLDRSVSLLGDASIPVMLLILGLQLQKANIRQNFKLIFMSNGLRLIVSPLIAAGLAALIGLNAIPENAVILQAGMPSAAMTTVLATEYDLEPSLITAIVTFSTILSPISLTILIALLGGG